MASVPESESQVSTGEVPPPPTQQGDNYKRNLARVISSASSQGKDSGQLNMVNEEKTPGNSQLIIQPTLKRYIILILFCVQAGNKSYQWLQVASAGTKATVLYDTSNYMINLTSSLFMLAYVLLSWPACFVIENIGLRNSVLIAAFGATLGAIIKCFSCLSEGIWLLILGQTLVALSEQLIFVLPSRLASVWFPDHQVSLCVALCVVGNQLGLAMGFLVPQWFLQGTETQAEIAQGFYHMYLATACLSIIFLIACILLFDDQPKHVPGAARARQLTLELEKRQAMLTEANNRKSVEANNRKSETNNKNDTQVSIWMKMADLFGQISVSFRDRQLMLLASSYGIIVGINYTITALLDQLLKPIWPHDDLVVGNTGFLIIVAGILATPIWGRAMDRWHAYKTINLVIAIGTLGSLCLLFYAMVGLHSVLGIYLAAAMFGAFNIGFIVSGLEYAVELTYPAPELITSSVVNLMPQIHSTIYIFVASHITDTYGLLPASGFFLALMLLALVFLISTRETLKRQAAIAQMGASLSKVPARRAFVHA